MFNIQNPLKVKQTLAGLFLPLLNAIRVRLVLGFGLYNFVLHLTEKNVLYLLPIKVRGKFGSGGLVKLLGGHIINKMLAKNGRDSRNEFGTRLSGRFLALLVRGGRISAGLGKLLTHFRGNGNGFTNFGFLFIGKIIEFTSIEGLNEGLEGFVLSHSFSTFLVCKGFPSLDYVVIISQIWEFVKLRIY